MATTSGYIPASEVMASGAQAAGDPTMGIVGRPRYLSFAQEGLQKMCQDTQFEQRLFTEAMPANGILDLPRWMAGMDGVWVHDGSNCAPVGTVNIYEKSGYFHNGDMGPGFSHSPWDASRDAMQMGANGGTNQVYFGQEPWDLRYYGIRRGQMFLSPSCRGFGFVRIAYSGLGFDEFCQDTDIEIPMWARFAIADFITMRAAELRQFEEGKTQLMRAVLADKQKQMTAYDGTWTTAMGYWGGLDRKERSDVVLYISKLGVGGEHF